MQSPDAQMRRTNRRPAKEEIRWRRFPHPLRNRLIKISNQNQALTPPPFSSLFFWRSSAKNESWNFRSNRDKYEPKKRERNVFNLQRWKITYVFFFFFLKYWTFSWGVVDWFAKYTICSSFDTWHLKWKTPDKYDTKKKKKQPKITETIRHK